MKLMRMSAALLLALLLACFPGSPPPAPTAAPAPVAQTVREDEKTPAPSLEPTVVTLDSPSPLVEVKLMIKTGSTADPVGKEGLAALTANALLEGSFGDPANPITKERLAEITQPWGQGALPSVRVASRTTTFNFTVPRDVLGRYIAQIMRPMMTQPLFAQDEIDRLKNEMSSRITSARFEDLESLGLAAIDAFVLSGTRYEHQPFGSETSIPKLTRDDVVSFYRSFYRPGNTIVGVSTRDASVVDPIKSVAGAMNATATDVVPAPPLGSVAPVKGRSAVVIEEPNAPAASVHLGFPLTINRTHPDFWPLYVANVHLGTHRDSFGRLYQLIREERGYNYGNYSYIEFVTARPFALFPPFNTPREEQYFSIWIRPVQHDYAYHLMKAATFEVENLIRTGLTDEEVTAAKNKAKVLYLNLGETVDRLLAARVDDAYYGLAPGYLEGYLSRIDAVTTRQVNDAIRKHLQTANVKYVVVTDSKHAEGLVQQIRENRPAFGKTPKEYQLERVKLPDGKMVWQVPDERLETLRRDALWANDPLNVGEVRLVPVTSIFRSGSFIAP